MNKQTIVVSMPYQKASKHAPHKPNKINGRIGEIRPYQNLFLCIQALTSHAQFDRAVRLPARERERAESIRERHGRFSPK
jgi:hypothetical protein